MKYAFPRRAFPVVLTLLTAGVLLAAGVFLLLGGAPAPAPASTTPRAATSTPVATNFTECVDTCRGTATREGAPASFFKRDHDDELLTPHACYSGTVRDAQGHPVPGASVLVYRTGTRTKAKLFSRGMMNFDYTGVARTTESTTKSVYTDKKGEYIEVPNPVVADKNGTYRFFVANGDYDLHVTGPSVEYTLADVTIVNPFSPHTIQSSSRPPLTLVERAGKTSKGNTALLLNRPGSRDANNCPAPYRIIVNKGECGWALTYNVDWDEINGTWTRRDLTQRTSFFRINGKTHALEYGNDYQTLGTPPVMETLFRLSADGDFGVKSHESDRGVSMIVRNNVRVNGESVILHPGNVVVLDPVHPFAVIAPRKHADLNPVVVREMDSEDPSLVQVVIGGLTPVNTIYTRGDVGRLVNIGDALVTEGAGSFRAVGAGEGVDPRAILGRLHNDGFNITVP